MTRIDPRRYGAFADAAHVRDKVFLAYIVALHNGAGRGAKRNGRTAAQIESAALTSPRAGLRA